MKIQPFLPSYAFRAVHTPHFVYMAEMDYTTTIAYMMQLDILFKNVLYSLSDNGNKLSIAAPTYLHQE